MAADLLYRMASRLLATGLDTRFPGRALSHFSIVAHRYSSTMEHLRALGFDGVVDGGANVGEFSYLVRRALPAADLVCVEPQPDCAAVLRRRGFKVVEKALWDKETDLTLSQVGRSRTSCTVAGAADPVKSWTVSTIRLDQLEVLGSNLLVKLDLQGSEVTALAGMGQLWSRCSALLLEVSFGPHGTYAPIASLLAGQGFREYSTVNELSVNGKVVEADKLWLLSSLLDELHKVTRALIQ